MAPSARSGPVGQPFAKACSCVHRGTAYRAGSSARRLRLRCGSRPEGDRSVEYDRFTMVDRPAGWPSRLGLGGLAESVATPFVRRAAWVILSLGGLVPLVWLLTTPGHGFDFYAYWAVDVADPYAITDSFGAFHYPPPFVWLFAPLRLLSFEMGYWLWTALGAGALIWLTGRWALAWLLFPPVTSELFHGNVHLLMAAALVLGFRATPAWAFVGLAKVTTGVIGLWPLLRGEWRTCPGPRRDRGDRLPPEPGLGAGALGPVDRPPAGPRRRTQPLGRGDRHPAGLPLGRRGAPDRLGFPGGSPLGPGPGDHAGAADPAGSTGWPS